MAPIAQSSTGRTVAQHPSALLPLPYRMSLVILITSLLGVIDDSSTNSSTEHSWGVPKILNVLKNSEFEWYLIWRKELFTLVLITAGEEIVSGEYLAASKVISHEEVGPFEDTKWIPLVSEPK